MLFLIVTSSHDRRTSIFVKQENRGSHAFQNVGELRETVLLPTFSATVARLVINVTKH